MLHQPLYIYLMAFGLAGVVAGLLTLLYKRQTAPKETLSFDEMLQEVIDDTYHDATLPSVSNSPVARWNSFWGNLFRRAGIKRYAGPDEIAGRETFLGWLLIAVLVGVFVRNPVGGLLIASLVLFGLQAALKSRIRNKSEDLVKQLPNFLAALKAHVQANELPERALLRVVDSTPSPLREELMVVKNKILANASFEEALEDLKATTTSRELKRLAALMILATSGGSSLLNQLSNIQQVLVQRQKVQDEVDKAKSNVAPSIWIATFVIPGFFITVYLLDPNSRAYWFVDPTSWICLLAVAILYSAGLIIARNEANKISNK